MIPAGAQSNDGLCGSVWVCTTLYTVFFLEAQSQPDPVSFPVASKAHAPFSWIKDPCEFSKKTGYLLSIVLAPHSDTPSVFQRWWVWFLYLVFFFSVFIARNAFDVCYSMYDRRDQSKTQRLKKLGKGWQQWGENREKTLCVLMQLNAPFSSPTTPNRSHYQPFLLQRLEPHSAPEQLLPPCSPTFLNYKAEGMRPGGGDLWKLTLVNWQSDTPALPWGPFIWSVSDTPLHLYLQGCVGVPRPGGTSAIVTTILWKLFLKAMLTTTVLTDDGLKPSTPQVQANVTEWMGPPTQVVVRRAVEDVSYQTKSPASPPLWPLFPPLACFVS